MSPTFRRQTWLRRLTLFLQVKELSPTVSTQRCQASYSATVLFCSLTSKASVKVVKYCSVLSSVKVEQQQIKYCSVPSRQKRLSTSSSIKSVCQGRQVLFFHVNSVSVKVEVVPSHQKSRSNNNFVTWRAQPDCHKQPCPVKLTSRSTRKGKVKA